MDSYTYPDSTRGGEISGSTAADEQTEAPRVTVRVHDGLEVVTRVVSDTNGSIVVDIYNHFTQPRAPPLLPVPVPVIRRVNPFQNLLRAPAIVTAQQQCENPFQTPRAAAIVAAQERMRRARFAHILPWSTRTWNLRDVVGLENANHVEPSTPPPTYQEAILESRVEAGLPNFVQPMTGETSNERGDTTRGTNGNQFKFFDFPSATEELPGYPRNKHGTSSDDSVQDESPVSQLAEPHQFSSSSSLVYSLYPERRFDGLSSPDVFEPRELEAIETDSSMPGTPRIEGRKPEESNVFADFEI
jgi:hypothetical protein